MAFGVAMLPEHVPGVSLQACANGTYNSYWTQFGTNISVYGLGNSIIRLGWEFNGNWYAWQATNPTVWAACWRQIVTSARTTAPGLQWDWNVNRGVTSGLTDPTLAYPGDAYVTTVGVDSYDMWPGATTDANWQKQLNGTQGLNYWLAFAIAHGKKFAVPEWGNVTTGSSAGGDNPAYVNDMRGVLPEPTPPTSPGSPASRPPPLAGTTGLAGTTADWHTGAQCRSGLQGNLLNRGRAGRPAPARGHRDDHHPRWPRLSRLDSTSNDVHPLIADERATPWSARDRSGPRAVTPSAR